ncbi:hypothetical protein H696_02726 [Fonticula alba]|uniref:methionyl-tRNA formyltransferase n=1 Tax=Fonticula alba TaxID=691883 RepID=A0A058Z7Y8_FONAL|nr:hypothetical protein H696_02726 [Fonticula alba]KCV70390.1 hypothetical protein H696_02726 [Fonticula alba]|eukprot:XP_009494906.1 hypothetical protein H696_02726 [Fonticula alba]
MVFLSPILRQASSAWPHPPRVIPSLLFFGSDNFSVSFLRRIIEDRDAGRLHIGEIQVVSPPDKASSRKNRTNNVTPLKQFALEHGLTVSDAPHREKTLRNWTLPAPSVAAGAFSLGIVASFDYFITPPVLAGLEHGAINIHPSLLPQWRGASPLQHAVISGARSSGISIQEVHPRRFDAGNVLAARPFDLPGARPTFAQALDRSMAAGVPLLAEVLADFGTFRQRSVDQDDTQASLAPKFPPGTGALAWDRPATHYDRLARGVGHQLPLWSHFRNDKGSPEPQRVVFHGGFDVVFSGPGAEVFDAEYRQQEEPAGAEDDESPVHWSLPVAERQEMAAYLAGVGSRGGGSGGALVPGSAVGFRSRTKGSEYRLAIWCGPAEGEASVGTWLVPRALAPERRAKMSPTVFRSAVSTAAPNTGFTGDRFLLLQPEEGEVAATPATANA